MAIELGALIISVITAIVIPIIVSWYSSDLRVAQMQKKRDHFIELVKTLDDWNQLLYQYAPITIPNPITDAFTPPEPKPITELRYHRQFKEHMTSGYSDLWAKWEKLSLDIINHTREHTQLLNDIASEIRSFASEIDIPAIFPYYEKGNPRFYLNLDKMAIRVFAETQYRLEGYPAWRNTEPKYNHKISYPDGVEGHRWDSWGETILIHDNMQEGELIIQDYKSIVDDGVFTGRINEIIANGLKWGGESTRFKELIAQEIEKVRLGEDMKGKCETCRKFDLISRITG